MEEYGKKNGVEYVSIAKMFLSTVEKWDGAIEAYKQRGDRELYEGVMAALSEVSKRFSVKELVQEFVQRAVPRPYNSLVSTLSTKFIDIGMKLPWDVTLDMLKELGKKEDGSYKRTEDVVKDFLEAAVKKKIKSFLGVGK